jgi:hypothetical protein
LLLSDLRVQAEARCALHIGEVREMQKGEVMTEHEDMLQDLALKLDLANMELQTIDEMLARRPALAALKHRTEKIEYCCAVNSQLLKELEDLHTFVLGHAAYLETCSTDVILENLPSTIAYLKHKKESIEATIHKAKGE